MCFLFLFFFRRLVLTTINYEHRPFFSFTNVYFMPFRFFLFYRLETRAPVFIIQELDQALKVLRKFTRKFIDNLEELFGVDI